MHILNITTIRP